MDMSDVVLIFGIAFATLGVLFILVGFGQLLLVKGRHRQVVVAS